MLAKPISKPLQQQTYTDGPLIEEFFDKTIKLK